MLKQSTRVIFFSFQHCNVIGHVVTVVHLISNIAEAHQLTALPINTYR